MMRRRGPSRLRWEAVCLVLAAGLFLLVAYPAMLAPAPQTKELNLPPRMTPMPIAQPEKKKQEARVATYKKEARESLACVTEKAATTNNVPVMKVSPSSQFKHGYDVSSGIDRDTIDSDRYALDLSGCNLRQGFSNEGDFVEALKKGLAPDVDVAETKLRGIVQLDLSMNDLEDLPSWLVSIFPNIEIFFLSKNRFEEPPDLRSFTKLTRLSLKSCVVRKVDPVVQFPTTLVHLILSDNKISKFSSSLCEAMSRTDSTPSSMPVSYGHIRKLMLGSNRITSIGPIFASPRARLDEDAEYRCAIHSVELLRVTSNMLTSMETTTSLSSEEGTHTETDAQILGKCTRLAWVSLAGNPALDLASWLPANPHTKMLDITKQVDCVGTSKNPAKVLGQGTSGIVKRCTMKLDHDHAEMLETHMKGLSDEQQREVSPEKGYGYVAVKFFKRFSSDGTGWDEIKALSVLRPYASIVSPFGVVAIEVNSENVTNIFPDVTDFAAFSAELFLTGGRIKDNHQLHGVVFPFVPSAKPLAMSPNIFTATDDIYLAGKHRHSHDGDKKKSGAVVLREYIDDFVSSSLVEAGEREANPSTQSTVFQFLKELPTHAEHPPKWTFRSMATREMFMRMLVMWRLTTDVAAAVKQLNVGFEVPAGYGADRKTGLVHGDIYAHNAFFATMPIGEDRQSDATISILNDALSKTPWANHRGLLSDFGAGFPVGDADTIFNTAESRAFGIFAAEMMEHVMGFPITRIPEMLESDKEEEQQLQDQGEGGDSGVPAAVAAVEHSLRKTWSAVKTLLKRTHDNTSPSDFFKAIADEADQLLNIQLVTNAPPTDAPEPSVDQTEAPVPPDEQNQ